MQPISVLEFNLISFEILNKELIRDNREKKERLKEDVITNASPLFTLLNPIITPIEEAKYYDVAHKTDNIILLYRNFPVISIEVYKIKIEQYEENY